LDLYESNFEDDNILWENSLVETGAATFTDVTAAMSLPGEDLRFPYETFASAAADFNNDGWQDIIAFHRFQAGEPPDSPYGDGHAIFLNVGGTGFMNVAEQAGINNPFQSVNGVMGCQVGDLNGDGLPDVFIGNGGMFGNGGMSGGQVNQLFLSTALEGGIPRYVDRSDLIDFPAPEDPTLTYPLYPYRTHGTAFVDVDGDGVQEIAETNGGPASMPDEVREPNRLFTFEGNLGFNYFKVHPVGDGVSVSLDAIGTRFALTVSKSGGRPSTLWNTLFAGSGFSAQNGFDVYFGLKDADTMKSLRVFWPNGVVQTITQGLSVNSRVVVTIGGAAAPGPAPDDFPAKAELESNYPNPSNPETWVPYRLARESQVTLTIYNMMGQVVQTIEVGHRPAGVYTSKDRAIYWDGRNDRGERAASGVYFYTLTTDDFTATRKMLILK